MKSKIISVCLVLVLLAVLPFTAAAQEFDPQLRGSLFISLQSKGSNAAMAGAELSVFHVAAVECSADGTLTYIYTDDFVDFGESMDDPDLIQKLDAYVLSHSAASRKIVTDSQGEAICDDLPLGLYFVKQTGEAEGFADCTSFLVTLPMENGEGFMYQVDVTPKTEAKRLIDITIRKVWNTDESDSVPDDVTVQLLRHGEILQTAILSDQNDWEVIYEDMPESDGYSVKELNVPKGFTATYSHSGYHFTVTNTPSLAQTGQLVWPIPVLAVAGMVFLMMGFLILRKRENENA